MPTSVRTENFVDQLGDSFSRLGSDIGDFVPRLLVALLLLLVGHWVAKLIRRLLTTGLEKVGAGRLTEAAGIENTLRQAGTNGVALIGQVAYFLIFVIFVQIAAEVLQIDELTSMLNRLIAYLPLVAVALLVLFVAAAIANWAANVVRPFADSRNMSWVSSAVRIGVLVVGVLAAFDTLDFAPSVTSKIENTLLQYLPLAILAAGTIAFGVGGINTAREWWRKLSPSNFDSPMGQAATAPSYDAPSYGAPSDQPADPPGPSLFGDEEPPPTEPRPGT
ncbi:Conserved TM helix [Jiangella alkaliphila]|uniref:Conserved TM helix n=1 Tax=Jiangella alkaliphila TaxID=419479 RepID=A0A1H2L2G6_9ACTN|nr:Conserved TM helix [Jiangella alkaliphila]